MRVGHDHVDRLDGRVQLLGDGLAQGCPDVLSDFRLARIDGDLAVLADVQPGADIPGCRLAAPAAAPALPTAAGRLCLGLIGVPIQQGEDEDAPAHRLQEAATIQVEMVRRTFEELVALGLDREIRIKLGRDAGSVVHRLASFTVCAALRRAAMIRGYVPHRQILPSMYSTISWRVGLGFSRRRPTPAMIMPEVQ